jgi:hypothetical protein
MFFSSVSLTDQEEIKSSIEMEVRSFLENNISEMTIDPIESTTESNFSYTISQIQFSAPSLGILI